MSVYRIRCESVLPNIVETEIVVREGRRRNLLSFGPSNCILEPVVNTSRSTEMRGRSGEGRRSGATEREADIDILSWRGRCESGHEHQGKHNGRGRGTKKRRRVGADVGSRTDEAGAGGGHTTGEREAGVCIHRVRGWRRTCARISRVRPTHIDPTPANSLVLAGGGRRGV